MIRRPVDPRFADAVLNETKFTTIRDKPWPIGVPIMLFHWSGKPYRSKQIDLTPVVAVGFWPITITQGEDRSMSYAHGMENEKSIHETEGFGSKEEMDQWFRRLVKPGKSITRALIRFRLARSVEGSSYEYPCTDCGGDAYVGLSGWRGPEGEIISKNERLCLRCGRKRGIERPI